MKKTTLIFLFLAIKSVFIQAQTTLSLLNSYSVEEDIPEPSGLTFDKVNNQLFTVSDTKDIYRISTTGTLLETYDFEGDLEGITMHSSANSLIVAIEDEYQLVEYNYITGATTTHFMDYQNKEDPLGGLEGVTYNPTTKETYFVNEKEPNALIIADSNFNITNEYVLDFSGDLSALHYVPETNNLWMGSDNSSSIYKCTIDGTVLESFILTQDGTEEGEFLEKLEGIAIDYNNQLLYAITDLGKILYVYRIVTPINPDCNGESNGLASIDLCGICSGGSTGIIENTCLECTEPYATHEDGENVASNILDDLTTRWSGNGFGVYNEICLHDTVELTIISIAFYNGDQRSTYFDIETSIDGITWNTVLENQASSGLTNNQENFNLQTPQSAWKLRFIGKGNSEGSEWNSVTKITWEGLVTGTKEHFFAEVNIYPNPVSDNLHIEGLTKQMSWIILNLQGNTIIEGQEEIANTSDLENGIYLLEISNGERIKFIK